MGGLSAGRGRPDGILVAGILLVTTCGALFALGLVAQRPELVPVLCVVAPIGALLVWKPEWAVPAFVAAAWASVGSAAVEGLPSPVELGAVILLPLAIVYGASELHTAGRVGLIAGIIMLAVLVSGLFAGAELDPALDALKNLAFLAIAAFCLRGADDVRRAAIALCLVSVVLGAGAVYSIEAGAGGLFQLQEMEKTDTAALRAGGLFGEPNFFALSLASLAPLALFLTARGGVGRLVGIAALAAIAAGVLASGSRGGMVALALAAAGWAIWCARGRMRLAGVAALGVLILMAPLFWSQVSDSAARVTEGRLTENQVALVMFTDHPLTGVGAGGYSLAYRDYARSIGNDPRYLREPHSLFLQLAAEQGLAGILALLAAGLVLVRELRRAGTLRTDLGRALFVGLSAYLAGSVFLHGSNLRLLYLLAGMLLALAAGPRPRRPVLPRSFRSARA